MAVLPIFSPVRRWQPPFHPFRRPSLSERLLIHLERLVKGPLFGCRMCGNCLLQETAFICPMLCPKGARNGPCGGSTSEHCYVDEHRPCVWYEIYLRAEKMGREDRLLEVLPPLDWGRTGGETWGEVIRQVRRHGVGRTLSGLLHSSAERRSETWDSVFAPVRQPEWWQGDAQYHPPAYEGPVSRLERDLRAGKFVITCEVGPPLSAATGKLRQNIRTVKPFVSAVNFTDSPSATPRMSSLACSLVAIEEGVEPVLQIAARDRTRTVLQAEVVGAVALGVRNILCLSGDHPKMGPEPQGRMDIVDLDSIQMLWMLRRMRDDGRYLDGRSLKFPPQMFLGAAASPFASLPRFQALREHKKVNAGAQFFQTNLVFDPDALDHWLELLGERGVLEKVHVLIGITPLKSLRMARYLHEEVPGVSIPARIMQRMERCGDEEHQREQGLQIALELMEAVRGKPGVSGIHLMPVGWEGVVPYLVSKSGLVAEMARARETADHPVGI